MKKSIAILALLSAAAASAGETLCKFTEPPLACDGCAAPTKTTCGLNYAGRMRDDQPVLRAVVRIVTPAKKKRGKAQTVTYTPIVQGKTLADLRGSLRSITEDYMAREAAGIKLGKEFGFKTIQSPMKLGPTDRLELIGVTVDEKTVTLYEDTFGAKALPNPWKDDAVADHPTAKPLAPVPQMKQVCTKEGGCDFAYPKTIESKKESPVGGKPVETKMVPVY